jgi:hypothetical protein
MKGWGRPACNTQTDFDYMVIIISSLAKKKKKTSQFSGFVWLFLPKLAFQNCGSV